ncbi:MAG: hypothetical protein GAK28_01652 [Luteibacter sp.]|uniref:SRPBCC domain-containing protein n=1 Tax=Luteibacter sp. TaxID=1886636 RepID=UPI0013803402|nr:SRPBCC domain-containing protein [Luteibacter sp.]KAF1007695.1 MAG: hypothetical protein GAK28_01652 [Luteibacter sp.]
MTQAHQASTTAKHPTTVERKSDRELIVTRTFNAPVHRVFKAWSTPDLFISWWIPKSAGMSVVSYDMDIRTGGTYRLVFSHPAFEKPMAFFGTYKEVIPDKCIQWTNEESYQGAVTTVTFEEHDGKTHVTLHEIYPTKEALEEALAGSAEGLPEQFAQLDDWLADNA